MIESSIKWFGHVWRIHVEALIRRVDQMEDKPIVRHGEETNTYYRLNH